MKNLLTYFIICSTHPFIMLSFNLGYEQFAQVELNPGTTREAWYKKKLAEQEKHLRDTIIAKLKISPDEWTACLNKARESIAETEKEIKQQIQDIRGNWIADYNTGDMYKAEDPQKKLTDKEVLFTINDKKINKVKRILKDFGYSGEVVTLYPVEGESLTAYHKLISIRPDLFLYDTADQAFRLRHELSHINNQDILFERAVKNCVAGLFRTDFDPAIHIKAEDSFDMTKLKEKNLTLDDFDQIHDLLLKTWWNFHEYRADMDAVFALKNYKAFKKKIKDLDQIDGYPLDYHYSSAYAYPTRGANVHAPVAFIQDFIEGLIKDKKRSNKPKSKGISSVFRCCGFSG